MTRNNQSNTFNSLFSIRPLVDVFRKMIEEKKPGAKKLYQSLLDEIDAQPELLKSAGEVAQWENKRELFETLLSTIFPPSTDGNEGVYAISFPFRTETVFTSPRFRDQFLENKTQKINIPDNKTNYSIGRAYLKMAYNLILRKFYSWDVPTVASSIHQFPDHETGLTKYVELELNAQFVDVQMVNDEFKMPDSYVLQGKPREEQLQTIFPISNFLFEGLVVIEVTDVTSQQVISEIKNTLLNVNAFSDVSVYDTLQHHIQTFLGLPDVSIGITPFFRINGYYYFSDLHYKNSILFKNETVLERKREIAEMCQELFLATDQPFLFQTVSGQMSSSSDLMQFYYEQGTRSLILCPLKCDDGSLIGLLEICSSEPGRLKYPHLSRIQSAMGLFTLTLEKNLESLELQIDKTIKEHFTAIQPAVEWKFTEAAFAYLQNRQVNDSAKISPITFNEVYPLYAAIDIKNSSHERNIAIQQDLLEQLNLAHKVLEQASHIIDFPLLQEIKFRVEKFIESTTGMLLSDDELLIYDFLQHDLDALFTHLQETQPEMERVIDEYFHALDPQKNIIYSNRKRYEESITKINDTLDRLIDREQSQMQKVYPHYFERYVTDGIDFNIYIGQSLAPFHPFHDIYVSNLKLWQLSLLVKAARLTNSLEKKLPLRLQTTQLILAHSIPLSISFRKKERKFDVDGAYNIRYEIIKKRIDKVNAKSGERLTQPGKIAIVYSQQKELTEYLSYIDYLQSEGLITNDIEYVELEELQGISGLRAIRIPVNLEADEKKIMEEGAKVASRLLLKP